MKMLLLILKRVQCKVMGKSDFDQKSVDENVYEWYQKEGVHSQYYGEIVKVLVKDYDYLVKMLSYYCKIGGRING